MAIFLLEPIQPTNSEPHRSATHEGDEQNAKTGKESGVAQPSKGQGLRKVLPLSGAKCFGDHCDFADKIRVIIRCPFFVANLRGYSFQY